MRQDRATVIVIGRNEEITDAPEHETARNSRLQPAEEEFPLVETELRKDSYSRDQAPVK